MAVSDEAGRALALIGDIGACGQADAGFWRGVVTRIVADLDEEPGAGRMMVRVCELLARMREVLPGQPGAVAKLRDDAEDGR